MRSFVEQALNRRITVREEGRTGSLSRRRVCCDIHPDQVWLEGVTAVSCKIRMSPVVETISVYRSFSILVINRRRARASRDITVPMGTSVVSAISR